MQLLEERDAELERSEASLEGHKKASDVREAVSTSLPHTASGRRLSAVCNHPLEKHDWTTPALYCSRVWYMRGEHSYSLARTNTNVQ